MRHFREPASVAEGMLNVEADTTLLARTVADGEIEDVLWLAKTEGMSSCMDVGLAIVAAAAVSYKQDCSCLQFHLFPQ